MRGARARSTRAQPALLSKMRAPNTLPCALSRVFVATMHAVRQWQNAGSGTYISELADNGMAAPVDRSSIVLPDTTSIPCGRGEPFDNVITVK